MVHLGAPPFRLQPSVCCRPFRFLTGLLIPMDQGGFVAPLQQLAHGHAMGVGQHVSLHG